jgi:hypothetical protein
MKSKQFALVIFFIFSFILCTIKEAKAADFYEHCLMPNGFGTGKEASNSIILSPLNKDCQKICKRECEAFSRKFKPYKMLNPNSIYAEIFSVELNEDVILNCYSKCQKGGDDRFSSNYFEVFRASCEDEENQDIFQKICVYGKTTKDHEKYGPAGDCSSSLACNEDLEQGYISFYKVIQQEKASVGMMCQGTEEENAYNVIETSFEIQPITDGKPNLNKFSFSLLGGAKDNQLYLCGKKHIDVTPIFDNIDNSNWYKMRWKNKYSHRFLATISDDKFNELKNPVNAKKYWEEIINGEFTYTKSGNISEDLKALEDLEKDRGSKEFWQQISGDSYTLKGSRAGWGAKNPNFFDTSIYLKNKDKLTVVWDGDYTYNQEITVSEDKGGNIKYPIRISNPNRQEIIKKCIWNSAVEDQKDCIDRWYQNSNLVIKSPSNNAQQPSVTSQDLILEGECFRKGGVKNFALITPNKTDTPDDGYKCKTETPCKTDTPDDKADTPDDNSKCEFGLLGKVMDDGINRKYLEGNVKLENGKNLSCTCKEGEGDDHVGQDTSGCTNTYSNYQCIDKETFEAGESKYILQGIFNDSRFEKRSKLALRHFYNDYQKDSGGYSISIDWSGCSRSKGENIQYAVAKKGAAIDEKNWIDVNDSIVKKGKEDLGFLIIDAKSMSDDCAEHTGGCVIFLRIKLETPDAGADDGMKEAYKYYNAHGQYYVNMSKKGDNPMCEKGGLIYDAMKDIKTVLVGPDNSGNNSHLDYDIELNKNGGVINFREVGAVGVVFSGFIKQAAYVIKIILVLYLVFFAISYMLGLVDYTTQGFIKYIMKFAIVVFLISDTSWNFFGGYLVSFFIDGSIELVARYSASFLQAVSGNQQTCETMIIEDPYVIFSIFNGPIYQFTSGDTWSRIWAIFTNGLL